MVQSIVEKILETIENNEWSNFDYLIKQHKNKRYITDFEETLGELKITTMKELWNSIHRYCIQVFHNKSNLEDIDRMDIDEDIEKCKREQLSLQVIIAITDLTLNYIKNKNCYMPPSLIEFVVFMGSILGELDSSIDKQAVDICEEWINMEYPKFEAIQQNTMIVMIGLSLKSNAKKQIVKKVWGMRRILPHLISNCKHDEMSDPIKSLLVSCTTSTIYVSCEEGSKFLSEIISIPQFMDDFHNSVKSLLPTCHRTQSSAYAEVYFRAWKTASPKVKKALEENCLQDLMYSAIHVDSDMKLAGNLKSFMQVINCHKNHTPTAAMVHKLLEPFIWRSLKAANGFVRLNVTNILCDAFPLTNGGTKEEEEALLEQQYKALLELLVDPFLRVRNAAIKGSFSILFHYWRILPALVIQQMFQIYVGKHLHDITNADGRAHVINGFTQLLDCAEAFNFINNILPRIAGSCDDINSSVRISFIKLLLRLKSTRHLRYWKLTSMEHLLHRLDEDTHTRHLIVKLIQNSFVPVNLNEKEWLQRTISFLSLNRGAARRFYQLSGKQIDLESATRFMLCIWRTIFRYVRLSIDISDSSLSNSNENIKENESHSVNVQNNRKKLTVIENSSSKENVYQAETQEGLPLDTADVTAGLIDIIVIMWTVNTDRFNKPENLKYIDELRTRIGKSFPIIWLFFKETEIASSLVYLSSLLPPSFAPTISGFCMAQLKKISDHKSCDDMVNLYLTALCNWNRLDDILQMTTEWLTNTFNSIEPPSKSRNVKNSKKVSFKDSPAKPMVGLLFLMLLLRHRLNRLCLLHKNRHLICELSTLMSRVKGAILKRISNGQILSPVCTDEFLLTCYGDYMTVVILLHKTKQSEAETCENGNQDNETILRLFSEHMNIMEKLIVSCSPEEGDSFEISCVVSFVECTSSLLASGVANLDFIQLLISFLEKIFNKYIDSVTLYEKVFTLLKEAEIYLDAYSCHKGENSTLVLTFFKRILEDNIIAAGFSTCSDKTRIVITEGTVEVFQQWQVYSDWMLSVMDLLIECALLKVINHFEKDGFMDDAENFLADEISFMIMKTFLSKTKLAAIFYNVLISAIKTAQFNIQKVFGMLYILNKLCVSDGGRSKKWKNMLFEETKQLLSRIENPSLTDDDSTAEFIGSCLKKAEELLENLQNKE